MKNLWSKIYEFYNVLLILFKKYLILISITALSDLYNLPSELLIYHLNKLVSLLIFSELLLVFKNSSLLSKLRSRLRTVRNA